MTKGIFSKINLLMNLTKELVFLIVLLIVFFVVMNLWGHQKNAYLWAGALIIFSVAKIYFLVSHTFKKLDKLIENNHSFNHMLLLLGAIITIIITSFAIDYLCISEIYKDAFLGIEYGQPLKYRFFNLLYFSIVTFTTVGYGDITPINPAAKLITVFEMMSAFIVIVFVISKYFRNK
ncbi:MAG TPA: potassium channel protein [Flavobacteriia bacterium]|nr:potassium channel protein [Flavobacteriia bacterium]